MSFFHVVDNVYPWQINQFTYCKCLFTIDTADVRPRSFQEEIGIKTFVCYDLAAFQYLL